MTEERDAYNQGYTHEALNAAHIACAMWDSHVAETRCADEYPDVKAAIEKASRAMYDVYQLIGRKMHEADEAAAHGECAHESIGELLDVEEGFDAAEWNNTPDADT